MLEGGYNVPILAGCVAAHLHAWVPEPAVRPADADSASRRRDDCELADDQMTPTGFEPVLHA